MPRRPPTNGKLIHLLAELDAAGGDVARYGAAHKEIQKIYYRGFPRGLEPQVVAATIERAMPNGYLIQRMTKVAGNAYDAAIIEGVRKHRERSGVENVLEIALVAVLAEHGAVSIADAYAALVHAGQLLDWDPSTNCPSECTPEMIDEVATAMDAWFAPDVVAHTLALADVGMAPTEGATWVNPPQCTEDWALLIGCALHPSEPALAVLKARAALAPKLEEPTRSAVLEILAEGERRSA